jgi:hypothetical protein
MSSQRASKGWLAGALALVLLLVGSVVLASVLEDTGSTRAQPRGDDPFPPARVTGSARSGLSWDLIERRRGDSDCFEVFTGSGSEMCVARRPIHPAAVPVSLGGIPGFEFALVVAPYDTLAVTLRWPDVLRTTSIDAPTARSARGHALFVAEPPRGAAEVPDVQVHPERAGRALPDLDGLQYPSALALDNRGRLLIADRGTSRIQRRLRNGRLQLVAAEIGAVAGMAVADDDTIYFTDLASDSGESRLRAIRPDGTIDTVPGMIGGRGVAIAADGAVWTAGLGGVRRAALDGTVTTVISEREPVRVPGRGDVHMSPITVAFDGDGNLYVGNFSAPILIEFSPAGDAVDSWGVRATQLVGTRDGVVYANSGLVIGRIADGRQSTLLHLPTLRRIGVLAYRADGLAVAPSGALYLDHSGVPGNGYSETPVLLRVAPDGAPTVLGTRPARA